MKDTAVRIKENTRNQLCVLIHRVEGQVIEELRAENLGKDWNKAVNEVDMILNAEFAELKEGELTESTHAHFKAIKERILELVEERE